MSLLLNKLNDKQGLWLKYEIFVKVSYAQSKTYAVNLNEWQEFLVQTVQTSDEYMNGTNFQKQLPREVSH